MSIPAKDWSYLGYLEAMQPYFKDNKLKSLKSVWKKRFNEHLKEIKNQHTDEERSETASVLINQVCKHFLKIGYCK